MICSRRVSTEQLIGGLIVNIHAKLNIASQYFLMEICLYRKYIYLCNIISIRNYFCQGLLTSVKNLR